MTRRSHSDRFRRGLTLVELLAALTLTVLLMGSVLGTLPAIHRAQRAVLSGHGIPAPWETQLAEVLAWDLQNSRAIQFTDAGVRLEGFAGRDFATRVPLHCPTWIDYELVAVGERRRLIRRETHYELLNADNSVAEIVCSDVGQMLIRAPMPSGPLASSNGPTEALSNGPLPKRLSITLVADSRPEILFARNFLR